MNNRPVSCFLFVTVLLLVQTAFGQNQDGPAPEGWGEGAVTVEIVSSADQSIQKAVWFDPKSDEPAPLLVALHPWSHGYTMKVDQYRKSCSQRGWAMIHPHFRGPNTNPNACGSELVVRDILDAVEFAKKRTKIDSSRIYLMGISGGGYASMLMAGRHPEIWAGVCSWVGIADLSKWQAETTARQLNYAKLLVDICGGVPGSSPAVDEQYRRRSAITWLAGAAHTPLLINHGIRDNIVPVSQAFIAFNTVVPAESRVDSNDINFILKEKRVPDTLAKNVPNVACYAKKTVLFHRHCGQTGITLFNGGHEGLVEAGCCWLANQTQGKPADWSLFIPNSEKSNTPQ
ncbi:MAG: prolyl oligopeptidase family serine peptidase [Planctomycetia bacterium]|nr:prolyl oligopeptidase family serine peptidase [Planctomycetia bacterium]